MTAIPSISWTTLTVDCSDAEVLGAFYSRLLGWEVTARDGVGWLQLSNPEGGISLNVQAEEAYEPPVWPEQPGSQAKMMHFEVLVNDLDAAVRLVLEWEGMRHYTSQRTETSRVCASCSTRQATPSVCSLTASSGTDPEACPSAKAAVPPAPGRTFRPLQRSQRPARYPANCVHG